MRISLLTLLLLLTSASSWAQITINDFEVDGIHYSPYGYNTSIVIPHHPTAVIKPVGENVYSGDIVIPSTVTYQGFTFKVITIAERAFHNNNYIEWVKGLASFAVPHHTSPTDNSSLTSVIIPNSVRLIEKEAFEGCTGLTTISIPNSVTTIGERAFSGCSGLESIVVAEDNTAYDSRDTCNAIIETLSNTLISGCKNTIIPNSVTTIVVAAFSNCSSLISITIPSSVTKIDTYAFSNCSSLTSITIPNSVTAIGTQAFDGCSSLTSVTIGNSVTTIGTQAFSKCSGLKDVYCYAERVPTTGVSIFYGVALSSATLHVPAASIKEYSTTKPWSFFGQIVALTDADGIEQVASYERNPTFTNPTVYDLNGRRTMKMQKGINLLRNADGRVKKVLRK
ncbi:MAG: leucine-rich repeat domain-containing protein [Bacteroidaceae bacterium]|nr:leucine-rich repeat domain-containing protein [Bacteroidaceae bacterium]